MKKIKSRAGFSLASVLIISVVSMAIMGGIAYMFSSYAGSSRVTISQGQVYNLLQEGIEQGKVVLREAMKKSILPKDSAGAPIRLNWNYSQSDNDIIEDVDELRVRVSPTSSDIYIDKEVITLDSGKDYQTVTVGGEKYEYRVHIFDMLYSVSADISPGKVDVAQLPPAMAITGGVSHFKPDTLDATDDGKITSGKSGGNFGIYLVRATLTPVGDGNVRLIETAVIQAIDDDN